jgi:hypothetical protein
LTVSVTYAAIQARRVTTQEYFQFDRRTGLEICDDGRVSRIDSVAPLPLAVLNVILGIDRKCRLLQESEQAKLTDAEIKALVYVGRTTPQILFDSGPRRHCRSFTSPRVRGEVGLRAPRASRGVPPA